MRFTIEEIAEITGGRLCGAVCDTRRIAQGVTWDSREIKPDDLFVALPGARVDGHTFVDAVIDSGAAAVLVSKEPKAQTVSAAEQSNAAIVCVEDAAQALKDLAGAWRKRLQGCVVALSGSCGKTTTKGLIRAVLESGFSVVATAGNQNNDLGVPRTLLKADAETQAVVVEMGMRGRGQLAELCSFATPDFGLITNVGESHIELLGSRENIARAKAELFCALPAKRGVAFVNADDDFSRFVCEEADLKTRAVKTVFFDGSIRAAKRFAPDGSWRGCGSVVWADELTLDEEGSPTFRMHADGFATDAQEAVCSLQLRGSHNVINACAAAAVGCELGLPLEQCVRALEGVCPEAGRQLVIQSEGGYKVIDDAYNANPASMEASLRTFAATRVEGARIAVLGDMGELGSFAKEAHQRIGRLVAELAIDRLLCVGELSCLIAETALERGLDQGAVHCVSSAEEALAYLAPQLAAGDAVLVKASHSVGLERVVEGLVR